MANLEFFREIFEDLATNGCIGDPQGISAYGYLRVSSAGQAEEGRSGLPRQILHVHEVALKHGYRIPWELMFADDHTGFEFEDRPALRRLREEYKRLDRRANALVVENLDRLSRHADWHQGYLLEEMTRQHLAVLFWKSFNSRIERAVLGAISQEGMEQALQRMREGNLHKVRSGRVTARKRAYGYQFVDSQGLTTDKARKDTHYAPHPDEAAVIRIIFEKVAYEGMSRRSLADYLEQRFPPPGKYKHWEHRQLTLFIRNPLYKGQYIANRYQEIDVPVASLRPHMQPKISKKKVERPQSDWIFASVPALVSEDLWNQANRMLDKNKDTGRRNAVEPYLLTGLVSCADCGYRYVGGYRTHHLQHGTTISRYYRCSGRSHRMKAVIKEIGCTQGQINCEALDQTVWATVCRLLLDPSELLAPTTVTDSDYVAEHIKFLRRQLAESQMEDDKLYRAYIAGAFDEHEYRDRRQALKDKQTAQAQELVTEQSQLKRWNDEQEKRIFVQQLSNQAQMMGIALDAPFALKQQILKLILDRIVLNVQEQWFTIEGVLAGSFNFTQSEDSLLIEGISAGRGSWRQSR